MVAWARNERLSDPGELSGDMHATTKRQTGCTDLQVLWKSDPPSHRYCKITQKGRGVFKTHTGTAGDHIPSAHG